MLRGASKSRSGSLFVHFVPHREPELADDDGLLEGVPEVGEVASQVSRRDIHIRLRTIADVPSPSVCFRLIDTVRE